MPTQRVIDVYQFDELSSKAKERARDWYRSGALDYEWWDHTYDDAKEVGIKITSFNLDRGSISGDFIHGARFTARAILNNHGKSTKTYQDAMKFLAGKSSSKKRSPMPYADAHEDQRHHSTMDSEFLRTILKDYLEILRNEEAWLLSDESVDETIRANEYEFNAQGKRI